MKNNKSGFGFVGVILVMTLVALVGFFVLRMFFSDSTQKNASQSTTQQVSESSSSQSASQQVVTDPNKDYVVIKPWGVRFKPVIELGNVEYFKPSDINAEAFTFTTKALSEEAASCSPDSNNIVLGLLTRSVEKDPAAGGIVATIGGYIYQYRAPQATCGAGDLESKVVPQLSQSLKSLEIAQ